MVFKEIPGTEGKYLISRTGEIKNSKGKLLSPSIDRDGYYQVILHNSGRKNYKLHYLVLKTYVGERPHGLVVNHKNSDRKDNRVDNLEYVTPSYNIRHGYDSGYKTAKGEKNGYSKLLEVEVKKIKHLLRHGTRQAVIAKTFNIDQSTVSNIKTGKLWSFVE